VRTAQVSEDVNFGVPNEPHLFRRYRSLGQGRSSELGPFSVPLLRHAVTQWQGEISQAVAKVLPGHDTYKH